jgi:hypothetical protein
MRPAAAESAWLAGNALYSIRRRFTVSCQADSKKSIEIFHLHDAFVPGWPPRIGCERMTSLQLALWFFGKPCNPAAPRR